MQAEILARPSASVAKLTLDAGETITYQTLLAAGLTRQARDGVRLPFGEFLKVGLVVTATTLLFSIGILTLGWKLGFLT